MKYPGALCATPDVDWRWWDLDNEIHGNHLYHYGKDCVACKVAKQLCEECPVVVTCALAGGWRGVIAGGLAWDQQGKPERKRKAS